MRKGFYLQSHRKFLPPTYNRRSQVGTCRWCAEPIVRPDGTHVPRLRWHPACVVLFQIANWSSEQRRFCYARDRGICSDCGVDTERQQRIDRQTWALDRWLLHREAEDRFGWHWSEDKRAWVTEQENLYRVVRRIPDGDAIWHADHIRPLFESNGDPSYFAPDNLQTLCTACHKAKSATEAKRRALARRPAGKISVEQLALPV